MVQPSTIKLYRINKCGRIGYKREKNLHASVDEILSTEMLGTLLVFVDDDDMTVLLLELPSLGLNLPTACKAANKEQGDKQRRPNAETKHCTQAESRLGSSLPP